MSTRRKVSIHSPTGRAASNHELAAITTAMPSSASAMPSRRWPGSRSRARPTERAVDSGALGQHQPARADAAADGGARGRNRRRDSAAAQACGAVRLAVRPGPPREPAFDLLERAAGSGGGLTRHACKPSRNSPIFTICHTGHRMVSIADLDHGSRVPEMTETRQVIASLPTVSKVLCACYALIAVGGA